MLRNLAILLLLIVIAVLPFAFRRTEGGVAGGPAGDWRDGDPLIVVVTPHNEAIRFEFGRGFAKWHAARFGRPAKVDWRTPGGTTEIMRYLSGEYTAAAKNWWVNALHKPWPDGGTDRLTSDKPPAKDDAGLAELYAAFRATDDPDALTSRIDLFFGGGPFDHDNAYRLGLTVEPWKKGEEPKGLFALPARGTGEGAEDLVLIPAQRSGETWRTPTSIGTVVSTFGICYNLDRLAELHVSSPPTTWDALAEPVYVGQVGVADPSKSGSVAKAFEMLVHQKVHEAVGAAGFSDAQMTEFEGRIAAISKAPAYQRGQLPPGVPEAYQRAVERGWADGLNLILRIGANARYFTDSASKVPIDVSTGDAAVGMSIDFYGRYQAQNSRPPAGEPRMAYLTPIGGSSVSCDPISLLRGAGGGADSHGARLERRRTAQRFIEFVLSEDGQRLWTYRPGEPGGPEQYALRRLPIRRDFYPSTNPVIQSRYLEHAKHAADDLGDPSIDPYQLAEHFTYYARWTASHFGFHREWIRIACVDAGDELKEAWRAIIAAGGPGRQAAAVAKLTELPRVRLVNAKGVAEIAEINWRSAPDLLKRFDRLEYTREWTRALREQFREAKDLVH